MLNSFPKHETDYNIISWIIKAGAYFLTNRSLTPIKSIGFYICLDHLFRSFPLLFAFPVPRHLYLSTGSIFCSVHFLLQLIYSLLQLSVGPRYRGRGRELTKQENMRSPHPWSWLKSDVKDVVRARLPTMIPRVAYASRVLTVAAP